MNVSDMKAVLKSPNVSWSIGILFFLISFLFLACVGKEKTVKALPWNRLGLEITECYIICNPFAGNPLRDGLPAHITHIYSEKKRTSPKLMEIELSRFLSPIYNQQKIELDYEFSFIFGLWGTRNEKKEIISGGMISILYETDLKFREKLKEKLTKNVITPSFFLRVVEKDNLNALIMVLEHRATEAEALKLIPIATPG